MGKKPNRSDAPADHPMRQAGWVHELDVMEFLGFSWETWVRNHRTEIEGRTTPTGRWFLRKDLVVWWDSVKSSKRDGGER